VRPAGTGCRFQPGTAPAAMSRDRGIATLGITAGLLDEYELIGVMYRRSFGKAASAEQIAIRVESAQEVEFRRGRRVKPHDVFGDLDVPSGSLADVGQRRVGIRP
jgi:hypothetical protein